MAQLRIKWTGSLWNLASSTNIYSLTVERAQSNNEYIISGKQSNIDAFCQENSHEFNKAD
jgi:hypothetical protein